MRAIRDGAFAGWMFGTWLACYCAFHAPMHFQRGAPGLERLTRGLIAAIPLSILAGIAFNAFATHHGPELRELSPRAKRIATRIAITLDVGVAIFWSWFSR